MDTNPQSSSSEEAGKDGGLSEVQEQGTSPAPEPPKTTEQAPAGAAHDTMCVADHVPTAMIFVPCKDGISHAPEESAELADAAIAAEVMLNAIVELT